jgi:hypothetical protein
MMGNASDQLTKQGSGETIMKARIINNNQMIEGFEMDKIIKPAILKAILDKYKTSHLETMRRGVMAALNWRG